MAVNRLSGRLLVISPHFDDACFSIGGLLLKKSTKSVTILTVFSKTNHAPNYSFFHALARGLEVSRIDFFSRHVAHCISLMRRVEDSNFCREIEATQSLLPFEDSALRKFPPYIPPFVHIFNRIEINRNPIGSLVYEALKRIILSGNFDSILCPLGIGNQIDHLIVLNETLKVFKRNRPMVELFFYEDLPYAAYDKISLLDSIALARVSSKSALNFDISKEIAAKQMLMDIYRSQRQEKTLIVQHARRLFRSRDVGEKKDGFCERVWAFNS